MTKSVPGRNWPISFAVLRIAECDAIASRHQLTLESAPADATKGTILSTIFLRHDQSKRLDEINAELHAPGHGRWGPTPGTLVLVGVFLLPPLSRDDARSALQSLRTWPLVTGFRGSAALDQEAVVELRQPSGVDRHVALLAGDPPHSGPPARVRVQHPDPCL